MPNLARKISGVDMARKQIWGDPGFNVITCGKIFSVVKIMEMTGLDVVLTDTDNVFRRDPFQAGVSFGDLIRSGKYDYIYLPERGERPRPGDVPPEIGGNTGFYFASGTRKPQSIRALFKAVVLECEVRPGSDQTNWWDVLGRIKKDRGNLRYGRITTAVRRIMKHLSIVR